MQVFPDSSVGGRSPSTVEPDSPAWIDYGVPRHVDPSADELRALTLAHTPAVLRTHTGSLNKISRNKSRMAQHTYVITDTASGWSHQTLSPTEAARHIQAQADHIRSRGALIEVQGWLGVGPRAVPVQWLYTVEAANIAGMQQVLAFPRSAVERDLSAPFAPAFRIVYTPDFHPDLPGRQAILVDLDAKVTYIMGPDYFGESKKAALRMLCDHVHGQGGLVLHAGAKEVLIGGERLTVAILGLSGTGKTTTTFSRQGEGVRPVQDDMVALWPGGELSVTENGCFAKTFGLSEDTEPVIWRGTLSPQAWLENAWQDPSGRLDFDKTVLTPREVADLQDVLLATGADPDNLARYVAGEVPASQVLDAHGVPTDGWDFVVWTANGRSIIPLSAVDDAADPHDLPPVRSMGILNRDEGPGAITPALVRFTSPEQAAGYFMLGETSKTSAAGKERGKTRSPFTQPFFPRDHALQAARFAEIVATAPALDTWMMNTGYVGGDEADLDGDRAFKIGIRHSSACLEALFAGNVVWERDPDFGYETVAVDDPANTALVQAVGADLLCPRRLYDRTGRADAYRREVAGRHAERAAFLRGYAVSEAIVRAVVPE